MQKALDCCVPTTAHIAAIKKAGISTVIRYIGHPGNSYNLTHGEADALRTAGIGIGFVFESTAAWMGGGRAAGESAARAAVVHIRSMGGPTAPTVYFACDTHTIPTTAVISCLGGAASVLGKASTGLYGGRVVIAAAKQAGFARLWQTTAWSWVNGNLVKVPGIGLFQYYGANLLGNLGFDYDKNDQLVADVGQWGAPDKIVPFGAMKKAAIICADTLGIDHTGITTSDTLGDQARQLLLALQKAPMVPPKGLDYRPLKTRALAVAKAINVGHGNVVTSVNILGPGAKAMLGNIARSK